MTNTTDLTVTAVEITAVVVLVLWRQLATRRVRETSVAPLLLAVCGLGAVVQYWGLHGIVPGQVASLVLGLAAAVALAYPRTRSLRLWRTPDGTLMRRGTWATLAWWLTLFALRLCLAAVLPRLFGEPAEQASSFSGASVLMVVGVTLTAQRWFLLRRAQLLAPMARAAAAPVA